MADILPINITISWVRHAESISNVLEGNYPDKKSKLFDEKVFNKYIDTLKDNEMEDYREYLPKIQDELIKYKETSTRWLLYDQNKLDVEKDEGNNKIKMAPNNDFNKLKEDIVKLRVDDWISAADNEKKQTSTEVGGGREEGEGGEVVSLDSLKRDWKNNIQKNLYNKMKPPGTWYFTPTLTYIGILQAIELGDKYFSDQIKDSSIAYDYILCSPTVRTIMTAIYSLLKHKDKLKDDNKRIIIVPYINEIYNGAGYFDYANMAIPYYMIDEIIQLIIVFVNSPDSFKIKSMEYKKEFYDSNTLTKEIFDTEFYKNKQLTDKKDLEGDYEEFMKSTLVEMLEYKNYNRDNSNNGKKEGYVDILAFTHGKIIDADIHKKVKKPDNEYKFDFPTNCSVWKVQYERATIKEGEEWHGHNAAYGYTFADNQKFLFKQEKGNTYYPEEGSSISIRKNDDKVEKETEDLSLNNHHCRLFSSSLRGKINLIWRERESEFNKPSSTGGKRRRTRKRRHIKKYTKKMYNNKKNNKKNKNKNKKKSKNKRNKPKRVTRRKNN